MYSFKHGARDSLFCECARIYDVIFFGIRSRSTEPWKLLVTLPLNEINLTRRSVCVCVWAYVCVFIPVLLSFPASSHAAFDYHILKRKKNSVKLLVTSPLNEIPLTRRRDDASRKRHSHPTDAKSMSGFLHERFVLSAFRGVWKSAPTFVMRVRWLTNKLWSVTMC